MRIIGNIVLLLILGFATYAQTRQEAYSPGQPEQIEISKSVHIYPNPAVDYINIRMESVSSQDIHLSVHNIIGNIMAVESEIVDEHEIRVKVKDLSTGYYLIAIKDNSDRFQGTYKFLKK
jgi:hypothetical protein